MFITLATDVWSDFGKPILARVDTSRERRPSFRRQGGRAGIDMSAVGTQLESEVKKVAESKTCNRVRVDAHKYRTVIICVIEMNGGDKHVSVLHRSILYI